MALPQGRESVFPNFISAESPEELRRAMFENNLKRGVQFMYQDIQFSDGKWYAWFHVDIKDIIGEFEKFIAEKESGD